MPLLTQPLDKPTLIAMYACYGVMGEAMEENNLDRPVELVMIMASIRHQLALFRSTAVPEGYSMEDVKKAVGSVTATVSDKALVEKRAPKDFGRLIELIDTVKRAIKYEDTVQSTISQSTAYYARAHISRLYCWFTDPGMYQTQPIMPPDAKTADKIMGDFFENWTDEKGVEELLDADVRP